MELNKAQEIKKPYCKDMLKTKYGRVFPIESTVVDLDTFDEKEVVFHFRQPTASDQDRFITEVSKNPSKAMRNFTLATVIEEDKDELMETFETYPGLPTAITDKLTKILGFGTSFLKKD